MNTPKVTECNYCDAGRMVETTRDKTIQQGRSRLIVKGLVHWECESCGAVSTDAKQFVQNEQIVRNAELNTRGYVSIGMLREFREKYSLSQRAAGQLIGAGKSAFGKYESGHHLSAPTAKLIRVALALPEVVKILAKEEGLDIDVPKPESRSECWSGATFKLHLINSVACNSHDYEYPEVLMSMGAENDHVTPWKDTNLRLYA